MKKLLFTIFFLSALFSASANADTGSFAMYPGEELTYNVSFLGINLGTVRIVTEKATDLNGEKVYKAKAYMKSNDGIPFLSLNAVFDSWLDQSISYSHKFEGRTQDKKNWQMDFVDFNYDKNSITFKRQKDKEILFTKAFTIDKKWCDGLSLFFFPRKFLMLQKNIKIPTFIEGLAYTTINFNGNNRKNISIAAIKYPVKTVYFTGQANYTGVYGLNGNFEGWFSADEARVPIFAKMKVLVGNVNLELVKWKRGSWVPPKG